MSEVLSVVGGVLGIAVLLGTAWAVLAAYKNRTAIDELRKENTALRESNEELRNTVDYVRSEREQAQHDCKDEIAGLRQQVDILQSEVVRGLVREFSTALREALQEVLGRSETTPNGDTE